MCASVFLMCLIYSQVPSLLGHSPLYIRGALRVPLCCFSALCGHINDQQIVNFTSKFKEILIFCQLFIIPGA